MNAKILIVFGTRPEAIKFAPLIKKINEHSILQLIVTVTGQHRQLLDQMLEIFNIQPQYDFNLMSSNQTLTALTSNILKKTYDVLEREMPDWVLVQGDTTTAFAAALAAFYKGIKVGHVEAGLRTNNLKKPFPEESNRRMISQLTSIHFAPTEAAFKNLIYEGFKSNDIVLSGNTVIDAVDLIKPILSLKNDKISFGSPSIDSLLLNLGEKKIILVTGHRRESFGAGFYNICSAIKQIAIRNPQTMLIYPVHLNPNVQQPVYNLLGGVTNIKLIPPLNYLSFLYLLSRSHFVLTDSGGVQEEAPSFSVPVLVMRDNTERYESIKCGFSKLIGLDTNKIIKEAEILLNDELEYKKMIPTHNPFGDGLASDRIINSITNFIENT